MVTELLAALRAVPHIVKALERLGDIGTEMAAQKRREEKDETVDRIIAAARSHKLRNKKVQRLRGDRGDASGGSTDGGGI